MKLLIILTLIILLSGCNSNTKEDNNSLKNKENTIKQDNIIILEKNSNKINSDDDIINRNKDIIKYKENQKTLSLSNEVLKKGGVDIEEKINYYNLKLDKLNYNSNINNLLKFYGKDLFSIKSIEIGGKNFKGVMKNNAYYIGIDKNIFKSSSYNIKVFLKNGIKINTKLQISFNYTEKSINISNITPNIINNKEDTFIILQGNGFKKIISMQLNNNVIIKDTSFKVINDNVASIRIDAGLKPGEYFFNIMHTKGINKLSNIKFNITN